MFALVPGYLLWLRTARPLRKSSVVPDLPTRSRVSVLLAVRDDADWIQARLENLAALAEPRGGLEFWIIDGGSHDETAAIAEAFSHLDSRFRLVREITGGRIAQLDAGLACSEGEWVLVTGADARMAPHAVLQMLAVAEDAGDVAAVGAPVDPHGAPVLGRLHTRSSNAARSAEARIGSAAVVTAACYLFRRDVLPRGFAEGVIADDVHVAMAAAACGKRVGFAEAAIIHTLGSPQGLAEIFEYEVGRARACLREVARFFPHLREFAAPARAIFLWRAAQMFVYPAAALGLAASSAVILWSAGTAAAATVTLALAGAMLVDAWLAARVGRQARLAPAAALAALMAAVRMTAVVTMPFARRNAHAACTGSREAHKKTGQPRGGTAARYL